MEPPRELMLAGRIAAEARDYAPKLVKPGESCLRICESLEKMIMERGARPAFPCNISINDVAAHYTPGLSDDCTIPSEGIVKIDVGAAVEGYIADTAISVPLGGGLQNEMVETAREALEEALKIIRPGVRIYDIGKTVEAVVRRRRFKVIRNLSGHSIDRYKIHAGLVIPNYPDRASWIKRLSPGLIIAVEPFVTNGKGVVVEGGTVNIYSYTGRRPRFGLSNDEALLLDIISSRYKTLPFTPRWLKDALDENALLSSLKSLSWKRVLHAYPVLIEAGKGTVAQAEHTLFIGSREAVVVTDPRQSVVG